VYLIDYNQIPNTVERALGYRECVNKGLAKALTYARYCALFTLVVEPFLSGRSRFCRHPAVSLPERCGARWSRHSGTVNSALSDLLGVTNVLDEVE
jgi:hypothetical protein